MTKAWAQAIRTRWPVILRRTHQAKLDAERRRHLNDERMIMVGLHAAQTFHLDQENHRLRRAVRLAARVMADQPISLHMAAPVDWDGPTVSPAAGVIRMADWFAHEAKHRDPTTHALIGQPSTETWEAIAIPPGSGLILRNRLSNVIQPDVALEIRTFCQARLGVDPLLVGRHWQPELTPPAAAS